MRARVYVGSTAPWWRRVRWSYNLLRAFAIAVAWATLCTLWALPAGGPWVYWSGLVLFAGAAILIGMGLYDLSTPHPRRLARRRDERSNR